MSDCNKKQQCIGISGPTHKDPNSSTSSGDGFFNSNCPPRLRNPDCAPFQLTKSNDSKFIDSVVNESLSIGGADVNVYKMLGVHEQCRLIDSTGKGKPISNGDASGFSMFNAFDKFVSEWRSIQTGSAVLASAYIGYDFGFIKTNDGSRRKYGINTNIRKNISAIAIKQSSNSENRVTRARVERSEDNEKWYGVSIVNLPDDDCLNTILFDSSVTSRYWRLRPVTFNGGDADYWSVQALQMYHNYAPTQQYNIQDKILLENRDRQYAEDAITLKGFYDLVDTTTDLSRFGIELPSQSFYLTISFSSCVSLLGRPLVIGDIVELPSEMQYSSEMKAIKKWLEVTDVAWSTEGYTPGWQPTMLRVILQPAYASQETQDIFGDLAENTVDDLGLQDKGDGKHPLFQDYSDVSQEIQSQSKEMVPEYGSDTSSTVRQFTEEEHKKAKEQGLNNLHTLEVNQYAYGVEDGMPPNNAPFTEGESFPEEPKHGDYHRLTYTQLDDYYPPRLYRFSQSKNRWIYLETDKREAGNPTRPVMQEFLTAPGATDHNNITRDAPPKCDSEDD